MAKKTKATDVAITNAQFDEITKILGITDGGDHGYILIHANDDEKASIQVRNLSKAQIVSLFITATKDLLSQR